MRLSAHLKLATGTVLVALYMTACAGCGTTDGSAGRDPSEFGTGAGATPPPLEEETTKLQTVYFDFDRAEIRDDQKAILRENAGAIRGSVWAQVVVEGHCDERGSEEYNLALGARRADAVRQYLSDSGVRVERIDTVSFGESQPAVRGHDESAWSRNRRASFRVVR